MTILKFRQVRVGSFTIDSLDKKPPQRIVSRRERLHMQKLHNEVQLWVGENLSDDSYQRFYRALDEAEYDTALGILMDAFRANTCITIRRRHRWETWRANFDKGFVPTT